MKTIKLAAAVASAALITAAVSLTSPAVQAAPIASEVESHELDQRDFPAVVLVAGDLVFIYVLNVAEDQGTTEPPPEGMLGQAAPAAFDYVLN